MTRQKYLLGRAYDAASDLADAYELSRASQSQARLRILDERVRSFLECREECEDYGVSQEAVDSLLELLPIGLRDRLPPR